MTSILPSALEGQMVAFVTDMHKGKTLENGISLTAAQHAAAGNDLDWLASFCTVVGVAGDNVNWASSTPEDAEFKSWYAARSRASAEYLATSGNHDFANSSSLANRGVAVWATATGVDKYSHAPAGNSESDGVQVVALSQESMPFNNWLTPEAALADPEQRPTVLPGRGFVLSDNPSSPFSPGAALGYLRTRLRTGRPTWILQHYPMNAHINSRYVPQATEDALADIAREYPNLIGIMSGHYHANPYTSSSLARSYSAGGRTLAGVNGSACGGSLPNFMFVATIVSYRPGKVVVRWRDLISREWIMHDTFGWFRELSVSCTAPIKQ